MCKQRGSDESRHDRITLRQDTVNPKAQHEAAQNTLTQRRCSSPKTCRILENLANSHVSQRAQKPQTLKSGTLHERQMMLHASWETTKIAEENATMRKKITCNQTNIMMWKTQRRILHPPRIRITTIEVTSTKKNAQDLRVSC